jgi:valyl-tRNA synthetase
VERLFQTFQYGEAGRQIYDFFWSDFADWYVEIAKQQLQSEVTRGHTAAVLARVLDTSLRLLHPFTPFVTEELWGYLRQSLGDSPLVALAADWPEALIVAPWPEPRKLEGWEDSKVADFTLMQEIVRSIRNLRAEKNVPPSRKLQAIIAAGEKSGLLQEQAAIVAALAGLDASAVTISETVDLKPEHAVTLVVGPVEVHLPLEGMIDAGAERRRFSKELADSEAQIKRVEQLLASDFGSKAPAVVVNKERERLAALKETAEKLRAQLK